jgi:diketogulonate reductase-like aldo/keto reductase
MEYVTIRDCRTPVLGLGTYGLTGSTGKTAIETAISLGYRHIDTAQLYTNEQIVGAAIERSPIPRDEFFVVTKINRNNLQYDDLIASAKTSYKALGNSEIELVLLHAPSRTVPVAESIRALNTLQDDGIVKQIGVSNYSVDQLRTAQSASSTPILTNQVEYHPFIDQPALLTYCQSNDIMLTAYTPFANGKLLQNPTLEQIGEQYNKTPAQITLRWLTQQHLVSTIPKSSQRTHLRENIDIFDFELTDEDIRKISALS